MVELERIKKSTSAIPRHIDLPKKMLRHLEQRTGIAFYEAKNHFEAQGGKDAVVEASGLVAEDFESVRPQEIKIRNFIDGEFVKPLRSLSCRAKSQLLCEGLETSLNVSLSFRSPR